MSKVFLDYTDKSSPVRVRLPPDRIEECRTMGIPVSEIVRHRERYNRFGIPNNWDHCAVRAIEEKKMRVKNKDNEGGLSWF